MKIGKNVMLLGVMGLVAVFLPRVAMGENTAVDNPTTADVAPTQAIEAPAQPALVTEQPTPEPVQPAPEPVQPTPEPVQPALVTEQPTPVPVQPAPVTAQPTAAPTPDNGPMGGFTLTPKLLGYTYLGAQGSYTTDDKVPFSGHSINAMQIQLDLTFGGRGAACELAPFYMLMTPDSASADVSGADTIHGAGIYLGYLYTWYIPTANIGAFYPGLGFGWEIGGLFGSQIDYGFITAIRIPLSCTWYFSKTVPIGIVLEWGLGFQTNAYLKEYKSVIDQKDKTALFLQYGFYTDLSVGMRFF